MGAVQHRIAKIAVTLGVVATAVIGATSGSATGAPAAPTLYTETSLNLGKSLASNGLGQVVAAPPNAADNRQRWQATFRSVQLSNGQTVFGWQFKNNSSLTCMTDAGANAWVRLQGCESAPGSNTRQVWLVEGSRVVNGKVYWFYRNATTGRRLQVSQEITDGTFPTFKVISSNANANPGTALEALMLWNEQVVS